MTDNLVLEHLRAIRKDLGAVKDDVSEIKARVMALETRGASIETRLAQMHADEVTRVHRIDLMHERIERIEQRLGLIDSKH
jgi:chromosome segregation ATPase